MKNIIHLLFLFIFNISGIVFGQSIIYVNSATGNDSGNGSLDSPYKTFYKGYTEASSGDTLSLSGTFTWTDVDETGDIVGEGFILSKHLTLKGDNPSTTIIQSASTSNTADRRVFKINNGYQVTFKNLTIRNGVSFQGYVGSTYVTRYGGAIGSNYGSSSSVSMTLDNVIISNNYSSSSSRPGVYSEGNITVINSTFKDNVGVNHYGGGLALNLEYSGSGKKRNIINSTFYNNINTGTGSGAAAIYVDRKGANIINCSVLSNTNGIHTYAMNEGGDEVYITNTVVLGSLEYDVFDNVRFTDYDNGTRLYNSIIGTVYTQISSGGTYIQSNEDLFFYSNTTTGTNIGLSGVVTPTTNDNNYLKTPYIKIALSSVLKDSGLSGNIGSSHSGGSISIPTVDQRGANRIGVFDIGSYEYGGTISPTSTFSISDGSTSFGLDTKTVLVTLTEPSNTFELNDIAVSSSGLETGTLSSFTTISSNTYSFRYLAPQEFSGTVTFTINSGSFSDLSGNNNTAYNKSFSVDSTGQEISSFSISDNEISNNDSAQLSISLTRSSTTFLSEDIQIESTSSNTGSIQNFTATDSKTYTAYYIPPSNESGTVTLTIPAGSFEDDQSRSNTTTATLALTFDTISPTLSSFTHDHDDLVVRNADTVEITATFSEAMSSSPVINITGLVNNVAMTVSTTSSSRTWSYSWDVPSGSDGDVTATVSGTDLFGNYYSGTDSLNFRIDNVSPTLTITKPAGTYSSQSVVVTLTYDEAVTGLTTDTAQFQDLTNVASLSLLSTSSDGKTYTVLITPAGDGEVILTHKPSFPPVRDIAGNTISSTVSCSFIYDGSPPTINQITSPMADGTYTDYDGNTALSDTVTITVSFTESVTITGTPRVVLNTTPVTYANYHEGTGTATITFSATVAQEILQLALDVTALELNGGTITDLATNTASLTLAYVTSNSKNLDDLKNIKLDSKNPVLSNFTVTENNNLTPGATTSVKDGDQVTYGFQSDKELLLSSLTVTFTGFTPTLTTITNGNGPYSYQFSFTVSNTFPEGAVALQFSATDKVTTTLVPVGNPSAILTQAAFTDIIVIDRTAPTITSNANLTSDENTTTGPTITASENVFYSLIGGTDQALLSINQNTGMLTFNTAPDFEAPIDAGADNTYEIIVKAIDWVGLTVTQTVNIQINDLNDTFGVLVTPTDLQTTESGENASIDFVLITQPTANVTIGLSLSDTTEGSLSATQLTFTPENWNTTQTITINGVDDGLADGDVTYQLITANTSSNDTTYNGLVVDDVTLTNIDDEIDTDGDGFFDYQDAFVNDPSEWLDTDNDGVGNNTDLDDDGDDISDVYEIQLGTDPLDPNDTPSDFNTNGIPDALEDSDGDGYNDDIDLYPLDPTRAIDNDGDGIADTDDDDDDNDGIPDDQDDFPLDNRYSKDTDNDGIPNLIDLDDDGDGYDDAEDVFPLDGAEHEDTDLDGIGNNADTDDDGDGITDVAEDEFITIKQVYTIEVQGSNKSIFVPIPKTPIERKNVGKWKVRKRISGGADRDKFVIKGGEPASQGIVDQQKNKESEGYLVFITPPDINKPKDHNKDNIYEVELSYINTIGGDERVPDPEYKGEIKVNSFELNVIELKSNPIPLEEAQGFEITSDLDADSINNSVDSDDDGDGILTLFEKGSVLLSEEDVLLDSDGDGYVDFQDPDDDNDGIFTQYEQNDPNGDGVPNDAVDLDQDGIKNYLDSDDDGDGIPTFNENSDPNDDGNPSDALDFDNDATPDYLDNDDDNDGLLTSLEGLKDTDGDGTPDYHDTDDDGDGVPTFFELDTSGKPIDSDGDGIIHAIDADDDGDGILTSLEDLNGNGDPRDDDTDNDGTPNYLESSLLDKDEDGVVDQFDSVDDDPYNDQDGDGYPNLDETIAGSDPLDPNSLPQAFQNPALRASIDIVSFFSPNSDGINDTWQVKEIDRYPNNQVWIFSRSGYEVFNTQNYRNDWTGTQNGNPLPEGSYYYRIDLDGNSTIDFEGWLYLTR